MIRRGRPLWAKRPIRQNASNSSALALNKGITREAEKVRDRLIERERIAAVRKDVWVRSGGYCETCRQTETDALREGRAGKIAHEANEVYPRAFTRRMPPECRFDARWTLRQCPVCHRRFHAGLVVIWFMNVAKGANGSFITSETGEPCPAYWFTAEQVWRYAMVEREKACCVIKIGG